MATDYTIYAFQVCVFVNNLLICGNLVSSVF